MRGLSSRLRRHGYGGHRVCAGLALLLLTCTVDAQEVDEPGLKAAFIQQFAKFIEWPGDATAPGAPRVFCIADEAVVKAATLLVTNRTIGGRTTAVRRVDPSEPLEECSILFVGGDETSRIAAFLVATRDSPVFTLGDSPVFTREGGIARFFLADNRIRFAINPAAAHRAGLKLRSQLLSLAEILKEP